MSNCTTPAQFQTSQHSQQLRQQNDQSKGSLWLLASFVASILFTTSAVIRGLTSDQFLTTKGLLSVASFGHGLCYIVGTKIYRSCKGDPTPLCWSQPERNLHGDAIPGSYRLRKRILLVFMIRGLLEFLGSSFLLLALKIALENSMNQGISTAMMTLAGFNITFMSWCIYGERLNWPQLVGMAGILSAVFLMGFF